MFKSLKGLNNLVSRPESSEVKPKDKKVAKVEYTRVEGSKAIGSGAQSEVYVCLFLSLYYFLITYS